MRRTFRLVFVILIWLSVSLSACSGGSAVGNAQEPSLNVSPAVTAAATPPLSYPPTQKFLSPEAVQSLFNGLLANLPAAKAYGYIQPDALKTELASTQKPFLLDVRDPADIQSRGYIMGAVNIPLRNLFNNLDKLPSQDASIVVYSNYGNRSGMAMAALMLVGYTNVLNLAGGLSSWVHAAQYPVVTGSYPAAPKELTPNPVISDLTTYNMLNSFLTNLPSDYYQVDAPTLSQELSSGNPPTVVDMNTAADHKQNGYIAGALFIGFSDFFNNLSQLPSKDTPIVVYAVGGGESSILVMGLQEMGYTKAQSLKGGILAWKNAGLPVQTGGSN